jgi:hypothetical protein
MTRERFWRCVPCEAVIRLLRDGEVSGADLLGPLWYAAAQQERAAFLAAHRAHVIELLTQVTPVVGASGPLWDPATVVRWEVCNVSRRFVVEGSRTARAAQPEAVTPDVPLSYRCLPGRLRATITSVGIPADDLAAAIDRALFPHALPLGRLRGLTAVAARSLEELGTDGLDVLYDSPTDPTLAVARLPADALEHVIVGLRPHLEPGEHNRLAACLRQLHAGDGLVLALTRQYTVDPDA